MVNLQVFPAILILSFLALMVDPTKAHHLLWGLLSLSGAFLPPALSFVTLIFIHSFGRMPPSVVWLMASYEEIQVWGRGRGAGLVFILFLNSWYTDVNKSQTAWKRTYWRVSLFPLSPDTQFPLWEANPVPNFCVSFRDNTREMAHGGSPTLNWVVQCVCDCLSDCGYSVA